MRHGFHGREGNNVGRILRNSRQLVQAENQLNFRHRRDFRWRQSKVLRPHSISSRRSTLDRAAIVCASPLSSPLPEGTGPPSIRFCRALQTGPRESALGPRGLRRYHHPLPRKGDGLVLFSAVFLGLISERFRWTIANLFGLWYDIRIETSFLNFLIRSRCQRGGGFFAGVQLGG